MSTTKAKVSTITVADDGFYVTFTQDIGYLKAGAEIHLQLSDDIEGFKEGESYAQSTLGQCNAVLKAEHSAEELSIMLIIKSNHVDHVDFKRVSVELKSIDDGRFVTEQALLTILQDDDFYTLVEYDEYYKNSCDIVWRVRTDLDYRYDSYDLECLFALGTEC